MSSAGLSTRRCLRTAKITFFSRDFLFRIYEYPKFLLTMWNYLQLSFSTTWYFNISCTSGHEPNLSHRLSYGKMFPKTCLNKIVVSSLSSRRPNFQQDSWNLACIIILKKKKSMPGSSKTRLAQPTGAFLASCFSNIIFK